MDTDRISDIELSVSNSKF